MISGYRSKLDSIKIRTLVLTCGTAFFSLITISIMSFYFAWGEIKKETKEKYSHKLQTIAEETSAFLGRDSGLCSDIARFAETGLAMKDRSEIVSILTNQINKRPDIYGSGIWFEPFAHKSKKK